MSLIHPVKEISSVTGSDTKLVFLDWKLWRADPQFLLHSQIYCSLVYLKQLQVIQVQTQAQPEKLSLESSESWTKIR